MLRGPAPITLALALGAAGTVFSGAAPARADFDLQAAFTTGASWKRSMPALSSDEATTAARTVPQTRVPIGGAVTALGAGFDVGFTIDDRWTIPFLGLAGYGAVGSYPTIVTSADGSIAHVRPWTTYEIDGLLPGIGMRLKKRRWMFGANLRMGVTYVHVDGAVAGGGGETGTSFSNASFLLQTELEACRRLDPTTRLCLQVAPRLYEFGFMNGATVGLRVEWGR